MAHESVASSTTHDVKVATRPLFIRDRRRLMRGSQGESGAGRAQGPSGRLLSHRSTRSRRSPEHQRKCTGARENVTLTRSHADIIRASSQVSPTTWISSRAGTVSGLRAPWASVSVAVSATGEASATVARATVTQVSRGPAEEQAQNEGEHVAEGWFPAEREGYTAVSRVGVDPSRTWADRRCEPGQFPWPLSVFFLQGPSRKHKPGQFRPKQHRAEMIGVGEERSVNHESSQQEAAEPRQRRSGL
jgi:hypothetical protein